MSWCTRAGLMLALLAAGVQGVSAQKTVQSGPGFALENQDLRAQLTPRRHSTLAAGLAVQIARISVREGEKFRMGQVLIEFDCAVQAAQLDKARAQLTGASNTHRGNQHLAELKAIGEIELKNSEVEVSKARAEVAYLQATLNQCSLRAPFAGRAGELKARELQFVQVGQPLLEIIDDSALELEFRVPSRWLTWLKPGHRFEVQIDETGKTYPARLLRIAARADPVSQSVKSVAVIDGEYSELIAGMSGRVLLAPAN